MNIKNIGIAAALIGGIAASVMGYKMRGSYGDKDHKTHKK